MSSPTTYNFEIEVNKTTRHPHPHAFYRGLSLNLDGTTTQLQNGSRQT